MEGEVVGLVALGSTIGAGLAIGIGVVGPAMGQGEIAKTAISAMTQQPDEKNTIRGTMFVTMAIVESAAIYALLVSMILIFANPFWDYVKDPVAEMKKEQAVKMYKDSMGGSVGGH